MQNTTTASTYRGYTINTGKDNNLPCKTKTLDQLTDSIENMISNHSKVLAVRLDMHSERNSERTLTRRDVTRDVYKRQDLLGCLYGTWFMFGG